MEALIVLLTIVFIATVVILIPVVLMQSGGGAQAGMFGSEMAMGSFGAKTTEVLLKFTGWLSAIFMISAFLLGLLQARQGKINAAKNSAVTQNEQKAPSDQKDGKAPAAGDATNAVAPGMGDAVAPLEPLSTNE